MSRRRERVRAKAKPLFEGASTSVHLDIEPLRCPKCNAPLPLGTADVATCGFCQTEVPLPEEYRELRANRQQHSADRATAEALYKKLGKPPGPLLRGWVTFTELVGAGVLGIVYLIVSACAVLAFLAGFAIAFLSHAIAGLIGIDFVERFGGFTTYAGVVVILALFVALPMWLKSYLETSGEIRRTLQANLAARFPEKPGFPSTCRLCGAALDVPKDALGVRCEYCEADNLVAVPDALVRAVRDTQQSFHKNIVDADARARELRRDARKGVLGSAKYFGIAALALGVVGKGCVALDIDHDLPSFRESMGPPRRMVPYLDPKQAIPIDTETEFHNLGIYTVALHRHEVFEFSSRDDGWCARLKATNTTTFPFLTREYTATAKAQTNRTFAVRFRAPYTGLFQISIDGYSNANDGHPHVRWHIGKSSTDGAPPPPLMYAESAPVQAAPPLPPAAKALSDKIHGFIVLNPPGRPDLVVATTDDNLASPKLYSIATGEQIFDLSEKDEVLAMAMDVDGHGLAIATTKSVTVWSIPDDLVHIKDELKWYGTVCDVERAPAVVFLNPHALAIADSTGGVSVRRVETGELLYTLPTSPTPATSLSMSSDGLTLTATYGATATKYTVARPEVWSD